MKKREKQLQGKEADKIDLKRVKRKGKGVCVCILGTKRTRKIVLVVVMLGNNVINIDGWTVLLMATG